MRVCVRVDNRIGDEGAKALGDALKDNTMLTSLSLNLGGEVILDSLVILCFGFVDSFC
jgi:hypothetical protein